VHTPGGKERDRPFCPTILRSCPMLDRIIQMGEDIARLKSDIRWIKWLLVIILAALLGTAAFV